MDLGNWRGLCVQQVAYLLNCRLLSYGLLRSRFIYFVQSLQVHNK